MIELTFHSISKAKRVYAISRRLISLDEFNEFSGFFAPIIQRNNLTV